MATERRATGRPRCSSWEHHRFFDVWEVGYPNGWRVDRPGTDAVVVTGAYGEHEYKVEIARPTDVQAKHLASWVRSDLEKIDQMGAPRQEASITDLPAMKVSNLNLPGRPRGACPAVRVYARTNTPEYLIMTVSQADTGTCDTANLERLADALMAEVRS